MKHTTSANYQVETTTPSPDEETSTTNKEDNKEEIHTTIPNSLNLTSFSTNLIENPKSAIIKMFFQTLKK